MDLSASWNRVGAVLALAMALASPVRAQSPIVLSEASLYLSRGQYAEADAVLQRALLDFPDQPAYLTLLGLIALKQEQFDQSVVYFERAAANDPTNPQAHFNLGEVLYLRGRYREAEARYALVAKEEDLVPLALFKRVMCLLLAGDREGAETLARGVDVSESDPAFYYVHAALAYHAGDFEQGRFFSSAALRLYQPRSQVFRIPLIEQGWLAP